MTSEALEEAGEIAAEAEPNDPVVLIAYEITQISVGDRASLRRIELIRTSQSRARSADGVVLGLMHKAGVLGSAKPEVFEVWKLLAHVAAVLAGTGGKNPHDPKRPFGRALQEAGYSENRFLQLTAARGRALHDQIRLAARRIAQADKKTVNLLSVDLWSVLLLAGHKADGAEAARIRIAQDYYAAVRQQGNAQ